MRKVNLWFFHGDKLPTIRVVGESEPLINVIKIETVWGLITNNRFLLRVFFLTNKEYQYLIEDFEVESIEIHQDCNA